MAPVETVSRYMTEIELLAQLAEEAAELAQAALKLRRAISGTNPTPRPLEECRAALLEELADLQCVVEVLDYSQCLLDCNALEMIYNTIRAKMRRWAERLEAEQ